MFLVIDCRDSFVHNLVACLEVSGSDTLVMRESDVDEDTLRNIDPEALVLSPGPGHPSPDRGSWKAFETFRSRIPVLGVCLGHQTICAALGADIIEGGGPMHGKIVSVSHGGDGMLKGISDGFDAVRYNSLCVDPDTIPECLRIDATDERGDIMAVSHRDLPIFGVQFHPESFMTEHGREIVGNFVREVRG